MANFDQAYSAYYDLLYADKNYDAEADYIHNLISQYGRKESRTLLDIGCGTGRHAAALSERGYRICGIDRSAEMIGKAELLSAGNDRLSFEVASADSFSLNKKFDVVTSLFHVMSYLISNDMLKNCFRNVYDHLEKGGVFIFDFWYGPAVYHQRCENRIKVLENEKSRVWRFAEPLEDTSRNMITVKYTMVCQDKKDGKALSFEEHHPMRYFFLPELEFMLSECGFKELRFEEFLTGNTPSSDTWGVCGVALK